MTEAEWITAPGHRIVEMVNLAGGVVCYPFQQVFPPASSRKLLLFACACHRRVWELLPDPRSRAAVEAVELHADGVYDIDTLARVLADAGGVANRLREGQREGSPSERAMAAARFQAAAGVAALGWPASSAASAAAGDTALAVKAWAKSAGRSARPMAQRERGVQVALLRDIVGNPFRPVAPDPNWRTSTVVALATTIYEGRTFELMPILADALSDAGCDNDDLLGHLRGPGPHVRGCWGLDLVLDKT